MISQKERIESDRKRKESKEKIDNSLLGMEKLRETITKNLASQQQRAAQAAIISKKIEERFNVKKELVKAPAKETPMGELKLNITPARAAKAKQVMSEIDENSRTSENARKNINIRAINDLEKKPIDVLKRMQSGARGLVERHPNDQKWKNWYEAISMVIKKREGGAK